MTTVRVVLPAHLRNLAGVTSGDEVSLSIEGDAISQRSILDALEARYPMLQGTIRDHVTFRRRPFIRFFACSQDLSHDSPDDPLPDAIGSGSEPFLIVGAIAGGSSRSHWRSGANRHIIDRYEFAPERNWEERKWADFE